MEQKYLRVRGEEKTRLRLLELEVEIPPRARRRVASPYSPNHRRGNTSACAEKSVSHCGRVGADWKYLRVRGEEDRMVQAVHNTLEIPPRARRRAAVGTEGDGMTGNTSACAEKSA